MNDSEKEELASAAKSPELLESLGCLEDFREKTRAELLKGLTKRKRWVRGGRGPAAGCLSS